jgi:hypothetical protein
MFLAHPSEVSTHSTAQFLCNRKVSKMIMAQRAVSACKQRREVF